MKREKGASSDAFVSLSIIITSRYVSPSRRKRPLCSIFPNGIAGTFPLRDLPLRRGEAYAYLVHCHSWLHEVGVLVHVSLLLNLPQGLVSRPVHLEFEDPDVAPGYQYLVCPSPHPPVLRCRMEPGHQEHRVIPRASPSLHLPSPCGRPR